MSARAHSVEECSDHEELLRADWLPPLGERIDRAKRYVKAVPGTTQGEGADNRCFGLTMKLIWGFALPVEDAVDILTSWSERLDNVDEVGHHYPWEPKEISHKVGNALAGSYRGVPGDMLAGNDLSADQTSKARGVLGTKSATQDDECEEPGEFLGHPIRYISEDEDASLGDYGFDDSPSREEMSKDDEKKKPNQAVILVNIAMANADFFHADSVAYASVQVEGHRENRTMDSEAFSGWLKNRVWDSVGMVATDRALAGAISILKQKASQQDEVELFRRFAHVGDAIYWDLGNKAWECVEITRTGWKVVQDPPVKFVRTDNTGSLPTPDRGGSLEEFRPFCATNDENWTLIKGWLIGAMRGKGPYFVLIVNGEQGSVKSMLCRLLKRLIDPVRKAELGVMPKDEMGFGLEGELEYALVYDNVSSLSLLQSDCLCRLATGAGIKTRKLYTNGEQAVFESCRPVLLNGIPDFAEKPDLLDRSLVILQPSMEDEDRKDEDTVYAEFAAVRPRIFGALLDLAVKGLQGWETTKLKKAPRMADAARWVTACLGDESFLSGYENNKVDSVEQGLDSSPVAPLLRKFLVSKPLSAMTTPGSKWMPGHWTGFNEELRDAILTFASNRGETVSKYYPQTAKAFGNQLRRDAPALRRVGIDISFAEKSHGRRKVVITPVEKGKANG